MSAARLSGLFVLLVALAVSAAARPAPAAASGAAAGVDIVHGAPWNAGDSVRDGAGEFAVFLQAARLQHAHRAAGLVAVGDRSGFVRSGGERALRHLVLTGLAVVKLAPGGEVAPADRAPFLDGLNLDSAVAAATLARSLAEHGAPPAAADPERPTAAELAAIRAHLQPFQAALALAAAGRLAQR